MINCYESLNKKLNKKLNKTLNYLTLKSEQKPIDMVVMVCCYMVYWYELLWKMAMFLSFLSISESLKMLSKIKLFKILSSK